MHLLFPSTSLKTTPVTLASLPPLPVPLPSTVGLSLLHATSANAAAAAADYLREIGLSLDNNHMEKIESIVYRTKK